ncbi:MAG: DUF1266 domain-containing protein [Firmicutes bacterium]|nr:DUF1266 domain-containing protein [Bacillota bacterium]
MKRSKKLEMKILSVMLLFTTAMCGCGADPAEQADNAGDSVEQTVEAKDPAGQTVENSDPAEQTAENSSSAEQADDDRDAETIPALQYIELTEIEDFYGDGTMYEIYAPIGSSNQDGFIYYFDHGLTFNASVYGYGYELNEYLQEALESWTAFETEGWLDEASEYTDVEISRVLKSGKDIYQTATAKKEDLFGTLYEINHIFYMDIQENGGGVLWTLQLYETMADSETALIIDELAECYDVDLDLIKADGGWAVANEERLRQAEAANALPETILWFNATYAPLTYSNRCDWEVVGGMEPSEYNMNFNRQILSRDWGIEDAASALETVENLKENGHRAKCRECMEELESLGILDEKNEEAFAQALLDAGIEENLWRYVIAYQIHRSGLDADYIAAWDLCRVNQLYADFYICGYMTYEAAMDASLENSVILQQMYPSWEDMMNAYLLGYQFWQNDPVLTEDSPTLKRYQCYLDLLALEDGPYTLDWNMTLQKSW